jgi:hypothetical protein
MRSYRSPLARSARTSCTSVVRPSASTIRREIPSALPRLAASARTPPRRHRGEQGARGVRCSGTTAAGPPQECLRRRSATTSRHSCLRWTSAAHPQVSPSRILPGHPHHQIDNRRVQAAATPGGRIGPPAGHQLPMPAQQSRRREQESSPPFAGQQPSQHRQHQPVLRCVPRSGDLPTHHHQLMPCPSASASLGAAATTR